MPEIKRNEEELWDRADRIMSLGAGFRTAQALFAANRLGVFAALESGPATADEVAKRVGADPRATGLLLKALAGMDLLRLRPEGRFELTPDAREFLLPQGPYTCCDGIRHQETLYERWRHLAEAVRTGRPVRDPQEPRSVEEQREFSLAMANTGERSARRLLSLVDLSESRCLLDVGGAPGTYAAVLCHAHPGLRAVVFDRPGAVSVAREYLGARGMRDRITLVEGDFLTDPLPRGCDAALLSNVVHIYAEDDNRRLLKKVEDALEPGGIVILKDFLLEEDGTRPLSGALFSLNMLLGTDHGRAYTVDEMHGWLKEAGFRRVTRSMLTESSVVLTGRKDA